MGWIWYRDAGLDLFMLGLTLAAVSLTVSVTDLLLITEVCREATETGRTAKVLETRGMADRIMDIFVKVLWW